MRPNHIHCEEPYFHLVLKKINVYPLPLGTIGTPLSFLMKTLDALRGDGVWYERADYALLLLLLISL